MANKTTLLIIIFVFLFLYTNYTSADDFLATRTAIIHEHDNSTSKELGRLSQGDRVPILKRNSKKTYFKIKTNANIEGWVSKRRGRVDLPPPKIDPDVKLESGQI